MVPKITFSGLLFALALGCSSAPSPRTGGTPPTGPGVFLEEGRRRLLRGEELIAEQYLVAAWDHGAEARRVLPLLLPLCIRASRLGSALGYVERALEETPGETRLVELAAILDSSLGREPSALRRLRELDEAGVLSPELYYELGALEARKGTTANAERALRFYVEQLPRGRHRLEAIDALAALARTEERAQ